MNIFKSIVFLLCATIGLSQSPPLRNPQIQGSTGSIISGATLNNAGTLNGAGVFNFASGTVTLPTGSVVTGDILNGTIINADIADATIQNAKLANSAITIAGTATSLGGSIGASAILDSISSAQGTILYRNASAWVALSPGTSGQFLKTLGGGANPAWATPAGGGDVLAANNLSDLPNAATARTNLGLGSVENTALSTWAGTASITTLGTITTGTWSGLFGAVSGANLTTLNATNLASGTVAAARMPALTGDATTSAGAVATTLATVNGNVGSFTSANITVNAKGLVTAAASGSSGLTIGTTTSNGTAGALLYTDGANVQQLVDVATGQVLASGGVGVVPAFTATPTFTATNVTGLPAAGVVGTAAILGANLFNAAQANSTAGAASVSPLLMSGAIMTGGSATTNFPNVLISPADATASSTWSTTGTALGINLDVAAGNALDVKVDGVTTFKIIAATGAASAYTYNAINWGVYDSVGGTLRSYELGGVWKAITGFNIINGSIGLQDDYSGLRLRNTYWLGWSADSTFYGTNDVIIGRDAAASVQHGADLNGDAIDQTIKAADGITGTDKSGADMNIKGGLGTGAGAVSSVIFSTPTVLGSGTTAQTYTERARISSAGVTIGAAGGAIPAAPRATAVLDFASTAAGLDADLTITVTGAAVGNDVVLGIANASLVASGIFEAWVSASDVVTVRYHNAELLTTRDPASGVFGVTILTR